MRTTSGGSINIQGVSREKGTGKGNKEERGEKNNWPKSTNNKEKKILRTELSTIANTSEKSNKERVETRTLILAMDSKWMLSKTPNLFPFPNAPFPSGHHLHYALQDRITIHTLKSFQFLICCTQLISKSYYFILGNINHNSSLNYSLYHPSQDLHPFSTVKLKTSHINLLPPIFSFSNSSYILAMILEMSFNIHNPQFSHL